MIVQPGFLDHWKTLKFKRISGIENAPEMLLRLWASCQERRSTVFDADKPDMIASVCRYPDNPEELIRWLLEAGFLDRVGEHYRVHQWEEYNATLVAAWENGKKGGRPKTHGLSQDDVGLSNGLTQNGSGLSDREIERKKDGAGALESASNRRRPGNQGRFSP